MQQIESVNELECAKFVQTNRHNANTTLYYLLLKRHIRKGGESIADLTKYNAADFLKESRQNLVQQKRALSQCIDLPPVANTTNYLEKPRPSSKIASQIKLKKEMNATQPFAFAASRPSTKDSYNVGPQI